jgi:hypothetical protein
MGNQQRPTSHSAAADETAHRSLQLIPPPFHPDRARPRAVVYIHLSEEAVRAGNGVARVEEVGPVLLRRLRSLLGEHCTINLKPVIDLPAGHTRSTATKSLPCSANNCNCVTPQTCSPTPPQSAAASILTTPFHISAPTGVGRPVKPGSATSDPTPVTITGSKPSVAGRSDNPNPAPGCGDHPTNGSTSSTPPAPTHSAILLMHKRFGRRRQTLPQNLTS